MAAHQAHNLEVAGSSPAPATIPAERTCEPDRSAPPAAGASSSPAPAATTCDHEFGPFARAEIVRLADQGMGLDKLGARYRQPYAHLRRIIQEERARRGLVCCL